MRRAPSAVGWMMVAALAVLAAVTADARQGALPPSRTTAMAPLEQVAVLELPGIDREALLAEDRAKPAKGALRFASPFDLELSLETRGTWEQVAGGKVWRLRVHAPGATDLNFGFSRYRLASGATLHITSEDQDYYQGPYTAADRSHAGDFWSPVVPGSRAVLELFEPAGATQPSQLVLGRVGRGYRDLFRPAGGEKAQGSCNIDVICPQGDPWRNEIRSAAVYSVGGSMTCSGTLVMDVPGDFTPYFLTANHCDVRSGNASSVVVYWNYESPSCGDLCCGSLAENQSGAIFRAARTDNDVCLLQLEENPDPSFGVYFAGWDARTTTSPQSSVGIHHPQAREKAITFNDDPITTGDACIASGGIGTHWWIDNYEEGTTEPGSSGSGLWDPATHLLVGYLSGGDASCTNISFDCYGKMSVGWDGPSASSRLKDWLDPGNTGTLSVQGTDPLPSLFYAGYQTTDTCTAGNGTGNGVWEPGETVQLAVDLSATGAFSGISGTLTSLTSGVTVVDGSATWPNASSGGTVTSNSPHFTVQVGTGVACGTVVDLQLQVTSAQGTYTFHLGGEVGAELRAAGLPSAIPDEGSVDSLLVVDQQVQLSDVNVRVEIDHSWVGDLVVTLRSPSGTSVTLLDRPGVPVSTYGCSDDGMDVTFDDSSTVDLESYCSGSSPWYSGTGRPVQPLSAFNGQSSVGTWTLTVADMSGGDTGSLVDWELITTPALSGTCDVCGSAPAQPYQYLVGGVAHAPGLANTNWRTKLALLNRSGASASVTLDYVRTSKASSETVTLANGQLMAWDDVAVSLFGVSGSSSGAVKIDSSRPLIVTARTYNQGATGTYGQFLPGVDESDALTSGQLGVITQLARNSAFRTNVGFVNLGSSSCQVRVTLRDTLGVQVGSPQTITVPAGSWTQANDIFVNAGAGTQSDAYATAEVLTTGCKVWGYGSVVDQLTGDPTTIPIVVQ